MADDIKLVIKISEMTYKKLKWLCDSDIGIDSPIDKAIANGIPLTESDDYVSRKAVLDIFRDIHPLDYNTNAYVSQIKSLPNVQPVVQQLMFVDENYLFALAKRLLGPIESEETNEQTN